MYTIVIWHHHAPDEVLLHGERQKAAAIRKEREHVFRVVQCTLLQSIVMSHGRIIGLSLWAERMVHTLFP